MKHLRELCASNLSLPTGTFIFNIALLPHVENIEVKEESISFAAISSDDAVSFFAIQRGQAIGEEFKATLQLRSTVHKAHAGISCLQCMPNGFGSAPPLIVTGGRDGFVRLWTLRGEPVREYKSPNGQGISALAMSSEGRYIAAGTELETDGPGDVAVYIWDLSSATSEPLRAYVDSHNDTLTSLLFYTFSTPSPGPSGVASQFRQLGQQPQTLHLVSASTDGLITITDPSVPSEEDAVSIVFNNKAAVSYVAPFLASTHSGQQMMMLCTLSQDEKMAMYEVQYDDLYPQVTKEAIEGGEDHSTGKAPQWHPEDLRERLGCDYAIALRPRGSGPGGLVLAVGTYREETLARQPSLENTPSVDIYISTSMLSPSSSQGSILDNFQPSLRLCGAHGEEVIRDIWLDDQRSLVATCGEDGHVRVWGEVGKQGGTAGLWHSHYTPAAEDMQGVDIAEDSSLDARRRRKKHKHKAVDGGAGGEQSRFRPY